MRVRLSATGRNWTFKEVVDARLWDASSSLRAAPGFPIEDDSVKDRDRHRASDRQALLGARCSNACASAPLRFEQATLPSSSHTLHWGADSDFSARQLIGFQRIEHGLAFDGSKPSSASRRMNCKNTGPSSVCEKICSSTRLSPLAVEPPGGMSQRGWSRTS